MLIWVA